MSAASCEEGEIDGCGTNRCADISGVPITECCTIAVSACVQLVQSAQIGGQRVPSASSGHGSGQTDANAIPPSSCAAKMTRSAADSRRRVIGRGLYHMRRRQLMLRSNLFRSALPFTTLPERRP